MKKFAFFAVIIGLIVGFGFFGCNNPGSPDGGLDNATDVLFVWGELDEMSETVAVKPGITDLDLTEDTNNYPGRELELVKETDGPHMYTWDKTDNKWTKTGVTLGDIQSYGEIILYANLYDADDNEVDSSTVDATAHFSILKAGSSGWENENKLAEKYNMINSVLTDAEEGFKTITPSATADPKSGVKGIPGKLLVQGSYVQSGATGDEKNYASGMPTKVHVIALHLKLRGDKPVFTVQYGDTYVSVTNGNEIHFNDAKFGDGAVVFGFPDDWPKTTALAGKYMAFEYIISDITGPVPENATKIQINLQAANKDDNKTNGGHHDDKKQGQKYVMLDDPDDADSMLYNMTWTPTGSTTPKNGNGTFKIPFDDLLAAAANSSITDSGGEFDLTAIRIENNGDRYPNNPEGPTTVWKQKTYTLTITSITVEN